MHDECVAGPRRRSRGCSHLWSVEPIYEFDCWGAVESNDNIDWGDDHDDGVADNYDNHDNTADHHNDGATDNSTADDPAAHHPSRWLEQRSGG